MRIEAWSSGAVTGGLSRVELLRNGEPIRRLELDGQPTSFQTNWVVQADANSWYCVRVFGADERRQRAISGAFFFDQQPWRAPEPVKAKVEVRVRDASSGRPLEAEVTEVTYLGTQPRPGVTHDLPGGTGVLAIPATARLRVSAEGYEPLTLSPFFDHPELIELVTRLGDEDLLDWRTFERIRALLGEVRLTFRLVKART